MVDKTPDQWPDYYTPSNSEWRGGFYWARDQAKSYADAQLVPVTAAGAATNANVTANATNIAALAASAARNPAMADQDMAGHRLKIAKASVATDAAQLGQIGAQLIGQVTSVVGVNAVALTLPTNFIRYKLGWSLACAATAGVLAMRFSRDGTTFDTSAVYYYATSELRSTTTNQTYTGNPTTTLIQLNGLSSGNQVHNGFCEFSNSGYGLVNNSTIDPAGVYFTSGAFVYGAGAQAKAVLITHTSGANFVGGEMWLTGVPT